MSLASPDEPLVLADGTKVFPTHVEPPEKKKLVEVPTHREAVELVVGARRKLSELPEIPRTLNAISVVAAYTLFGLDDDEIALACGITTGQLGRIREQPTYKKMYAGIVDTVLEAETNEVRSIFVQHSRKAATRIVQAIDDEGGTGMLAAAQVLDRSGHRPADVIEHRHKVEGGLVIEIIRKDDSKIPVIDMEL